MAPETINLLIVIGLALVVATIVIVWQLRVQTRRAVKHLKNMEKWMDSDDYGGRISKRLQKETPYWLDDLQAASETKEAAPPDEDVPANGGDSRPPRPEDYAYMAEDDADSQSFYDTIEAEAEEHFEEMTTGAEPGMPDGGPIGIPRMEESEPVEVPRMVDEEEPGIPSMKEETTAPVQFSSYYPRAVKPEDWQPLHAYIFKEFAAPAVALDAQEQLGPRTDILETRQPASQPIAEGAMITATPHIEGFQCNPPTASIYFYEDWHRFDFKLRAKGAALDTSHVGHVTFTAEGVIVADVPLIILVSEAVTEVKATSETTHPYQSIFCSYSHKDIEIARRVEQASKWFEIEYLRDETTLVSGQDWAEELHRMIDRADVFQLFWSEHAATSQYVEEEWRYALALMKQHQKGKHFIRPRFWVQPLKPAPHPDLGHLHFEYQPDLVPPAGPPQ